MQAIRSKIPKSLSRNILVNFGVSIITIVTNLILSSTLSVEQRGNYGASLALTNMVVSIALLGLPNTLSLSESKEKSVYRSTMLSYLIVHWIIALLLISFGNFTEPNYWIIGLYSLSSIFSVYHVVYYVTKGYWREFNTLKVSFAISVFTYALLTLFFEISLVYLFLSLTAVNILAAIYTYGRTNQFNWLPDLLALFLFPRIVLVKFWIQLKKSRSYTLNSLMSLAGSQADIVIISIFYEPFILGNWAVARMVAQLSSPLVASFSSFLYSETANEVKDSLSSRLIVLVAILLLISLPIYMSSEYFIELIYPGKYTLYSSMLIYALILVGILGVNESIEEYLRGMFFANRVNISRGVVLFFYLVIYIIGVIDFSYFIIALILAQLVRLSVLVYYAYIIKS